MPRENDSKENGKKAQTGNGRSSFDGVLEMLSEKWRPFLSRTTAPQVFAPYKLN